MKFIVIYTFQVCFLKKIFHMSFNIFERTATQQNLSKSQSETLGSHWYGNSQGKNKIKFLTSLPSTSIKRWYMDIYLKFCNTKIIGKNIHMWIRRTWWQRYKELDLSFVQTIITCSQQNYLLASPQICSTRN